MYSDVTPAADIMYINKIPLMIMTSRAINFGTDEMIKVRQNPHSLNPYRK